MRLDSLADQLELQRLQKLQVLQSPETVPSNSKVLSTRFVRTWCEKHDDKGNAIWLRRSRFVAREFAWLEPERESLFSPASGSIISRILPTIFLEMRDMEDAILASLDVRDAFLTVQQECPTLVHTSDAGGNVRSFALGRVLPGQRDGSLLWYKAITSYLKKTLDLEEHAPYPCVLKSKDNSCIVMIHVDDLLVAGRKSFVLGRFATELRKAYDISMQCMEKPGDEITFLKRLHVLHHDGRMTIQTHWKHISQLCSLLGMNPKHQNKKTPAHSDIDREDATEDLSGDVASIFRTCVGILMYLANDVPHCQYVIRHLSTYSSKPTQKSLTVLKHLVAYLASHSEISVSLKWNGRNSGIYHGYPDISQCDNVLEVFTDSDWASDRQSRRSVSCCVIFYGGCLLFSASRTQKIISLSSAEAEVYASSSGCSDAILLSRMLAWLTGRRTIIYAYTDSSGAKGILQRQGVGRLRHLSCRILWLQQLISAGIIKLCSVSGSINPADIGTKRLSAPRLRSLMSVLGLYNRDTGALEGSDDPGKVFIKRYNVRALVCALSLLNFQGCESTEPVSSDQGLLVFTVLLGLVLMLPLVFSWLGWFAMRATEQEPEHEIMPVASGSSGDPGLHDTFDGPAEPAMPKMPPIPCLIGSSSDPITTGASSSTDPSTDAGGCDDSGMPKFSSSRNLPLPGDAWSPEAMLTWMYERCMRRHEAATTDARRTLYAERLAVLRAVMRECRSNDPGLRHSASQMTRTMNDISSDEESPNNGLSTIDMCAVLDDAERAVSIGTQLVQTMGASSSSAPAASSHVNAVADAMINMLASNGSNGQEAAEEEEMETDSDFEMETQSERARRYISSEMCEVSDPEEWMVYHHGQSDDDNSSSET